VADLERDVRALDAQVGHLLVRVQRLERALDERAAPVHGMIRIVPREDTR
jgi:hypothetical protein